MKLSIKLSGRSDSDDMNIVCKIKTIKYFMNKDESLKYRDKWQNQLFQALRDSGFNVSMIRVKK